MLAKILFAALNLHSFTQAWSLPGLIPTNYEKGQKLIIQVGQLESERTSFDFDYFSLNFCTGKSGHGYKPDEYGKSKNQTTQLIDSAYEYTFN